MNGGYEMHKILVGKFQGKRPEEKLRRTWKSNIKM